MFKLIKLELIHGTSGTNETDELTKAYQLNQSHIKFYRHITSIRFRGRKRNRG